MNVGATKDKKQIQDEGLIKMKCWLIYNPLIPGWDPSFKNPQPSLKPQHDEQPKLALDVAPQ